MLESGYHEPTNFPRAILRSLLQKAVRRGYSDIAISVARLLADHGDSKWLHMRVGVIIFEECWPLATLLRSEKDIIRTLELVARTIKNKNAAGLGALAYAYSTGDRSAGHFTADSLPIKIVAAGLKRPEDFFSWASSGDIDTEQMAVISAAEIFFRQATWPWDKAFTIAASYLAQTYVPSTSLSRSYNTEDFPYWVAIDKHTPEGKKILKSTAHDLNIPYELLSYISFYLESATLNSTVDAPWWTAEKNWKLSQLHTSHAEAESIWSKAKPLIEKKANPQTNQIKNLLKTKYQKNTPDLF